jgi:tetratricopeptide (TPR) repeat protein
VRTDRELKTGPTVLHHESEVFAAQFSPDARWVVTASVDKTARVWEVRTGDLRQTLEHPGAVNWAAFSPDGRRVITACQEKEARLWDADTGHLLRTFQHEGPVNFAQFSPDGQRVVTASDDRSARIWNLPTGQPLAATLKHGAPVAFARFSPDGRWVVTASADGTLRLWDARTGLLRSDPLRQGAQAYSAKFSSDGQKVVAASADATARVWELPDVPLPVPAWIPPLAEALAGKRFSEQGTTELVPVAELEALRRQVSESSASDAWTRWAQWYFADPATRSISPFSPITVPGYIQQRVDENALGSLQEAVNLSPNNPVALARLARALLQLDPQEHPCSAQDADLYSRRALQLAPQELEALWARAEVLDQNNRPGEALEMMRRASEQQPADPFFWLRNGVLEEETNRLEGAYAAYSKAIELSSGDNSTNKKTRLQALLKRASLLKRQNRLAEARADYLQAEGIPLRDPGTPARLIDLSAQYNSGLSEFSWPGSLRGDDLADLPQGVQRMVGVEFDVRGVIRLARNVEKDVLPESVAGIPIGQKCRRLHFLHATSSQMADGTLIGKYLIHYRNGQEAEIPMVYGEHVRNWCLRWDPKTELKKASEAWTGRNAIAGATRLFKTTWENPNPDDEIATVDFVSLLTAAGPFLVALSIDPPNHP